jgi:hypothetical protein
MHHTTPQLLLDAERAPPAFSALMLSEALRLLEDDEVRVRLAVGQVLRSCAARDGLRVMQGCQDAVLNSIHTHFVSSCGALCVCVGGRGMRGVAVVWLCSNGQCRV